MQILKSLLYRTISLFWTVQFVYRSQVISLTLMLGLYFNVLYTYRLMGQIAEGLSEWFQSTELNKTPDGAGSNPVK